MPNKPTKHHYVPQFYLRGFYDSTDRLHVYDRLKQRYSKPLTSKSIAFEAGYYFIENDSSKESADIEYLLGTFETKAQPVIAKLIQGIDITRDERIAMAAFVALQSQRVPHVEKRLRESSHKAGLALMKESAKRGYFSSLIKGKYSNGSTPFPNPEEIDAYMIKAIDEGRITQTLPKNNVIRFMLEAAAKLEVGYFNNDWIIVEAPSGSAFITSDNPVANIGKGFLGPDSIRVFPINKNVSLVIGNSGTPTQYRRRASKREVKGINDAIAERSDRYIIGSNEQLLRSVVNRTKTITTSNEPRAEVSVFQNPDNPNSTFFRLDHTGPDSRG